MATAPGCSAVPLAEVVHVRLGAGVKQVQHHPVLPLAERRQLPARGRPGRPAGRRSAVLQLGGGGGAGDGEGIDGPGEEGLGGGRGQGDTPRVMCYVEYRDNLVFQNNQFSAVLTDKLACQLSEW